MKAHQYLHDGYINAGGGRGEKSLEAFAAAAKSLVDWMELQKWDPRDRDELFGAFLRTFLEPAVNDHDLREKWRHSETDWVLTKKNRRE